jgi:hypothetical protein
MNSPTDFAPEPYLPWLRTDPAMQQPAAMRTHHTLGFGMWVLQAKECRDIAWV